MQNESWGPWIEWLAKDGAQPPVKSGTWVDAYAIPRPGQSPMRIWREVFQAVTGDCFRTMTDFMEPSVPWGLIFRYRVWGQSTKPRQTGAIETNGPENRECIDRKGREIALPEDVHSVGEWKTDPFIDSIDAQGVLRTYLWYGGGPTTCWQEVDRESRPRVQPIWIAQQHEDESWREHLPDAAVVAWNVRQFLLYGNI